MSDKDLLVPYSDRDKDTFKTLDLLMMHSVDGPVYIVVEGLSEFKSLEEVRDSHEYFYNEHTCPTNYLGVDAIIAVDWDDPDDVDTDPHGIFTYVDSVWMTYEYVDAKQRCAETELLLKWFPQIKGGKVAEEKPLLTAQSKV